MPWASTLSATVRVTAASTTLDCAGSSASTATRPKTTDAEPARPNQPMKATVAPSRPLPARARATGTMRNTVSARTAKTTSRQVRSSSPGTSMAAPKTNQTRSDSSVPASSVKASTASSLWWSAVPKASPATKAATKPLTPATSATE